MRYQIYIYADGSDLWDIVGTIKSRITEYTRNDDNRIKLIDDRYDKTADMHEDDLPDWNLGVNYTLGTLTTNETFELMQLFQKLSVDTECDFAVGYFDTVTKIDEDIGFIEKNKSVDDIVTILENMK
jgi:hypothetical protein